MPFSIGPGELLLVLIIALIVVGPGKLPDVGAAIGKSLREFRRAASDVSEAASAQTPASAQGTAAPAATAATAAPAAAPNELVTRAAPNELATRPPQPDSPNDTSVS